MDTKKKFEIEAALATEARAISSGQLKEENPLDLSDEFRAFCEACRRGDLKVCQEKISEGVNINARDKFDYTPLILVSQFVLHQATFKAANATGADRGVRRLVYAVTMK